MTDPAALAADLAALYARRDRGDVPRREFERRLAEGTVALFGALVAARLQTGERVVAEHHVVLGHTRLTQSVMREPDQEAVSLFATSDRLMRLRARLRPDQPPGIGSGDFTIDGVAFRRIAALRTERQVRWGEAAAGVAIVTFAVLFRPWLLITGTLMAALGVLGIIHALLLPTRSVVVDAGAGGDEIRVHAVRRRSARALLQAVRDGMRAAGRA